MINYEKTWEDENSKSNANVKQTNAYAQKQLQTHAHNPAAYSAILIDHGPFFADTKIEKMEININRFSFNFMMKLHFLD